MVRSDVAHPRGVLRAETSAQIRHIRYAPSADLAFYVEHYWVVEWNLEARFVAETLPHPSVHLVLEHGRSRVHGVNTGRFTRSLEGQGVVFGIKFRPGAFRPILGRSLATITGRELDPRPIFGGIADAVLALDGDHERVAAAESHLRPRLPQEDHAVDEVNRILDIVLAERSITRVEQLADRSAVAVRTLQRLFRQYLGVTPKWAILRYRLHEVLERVSARPMEDWSELAADFGYFDQAHFIREFKRYVGKTPSQYAATIASTPAASAQRAHGQLGSFFGTSPQLAVPQRLTRRRPQPYLAGGTGTAKV